MANQKKIGTKKSAKQGLKASAAKGVSKKLLKPVAAKKTAKPSVKKKLLTKSSPKEKAAKKAKRKPETLMCFLTTACVKYYSLPDNGYELKTLRNYRDTYLASTNAGKKLIQDYYLVSPQIVQHIEKDQEKKLVYNYIYTEVKSACSQIEDGNLLSAKKIYTAMVRTLIKKYSLG